MGQMKERMIELDDLIASAIENGAQTYSDVVSYVAPRSDDEMRYVEEILNAIYSPLEVEMA